PIFGATSPSAPEGLRPICTQLCEMEWPVAQALTDRTMARLGNWSASFGRMPVGQRMPLMLAGLKLEGGTPSTSLKSNVSMWLGGPAIGMKMTFFAWFCGVTGGELRTTPAAAAGLPAKAVAVTPAPKT